MISISQLIADIKSIITYTDTLYVIWDLHISTLIGLGEQGGELYYFRDIPQIRALFTTGGYSKIAASMTRSSFRSSSSVPPPLFY